MGGREGVVEAKVVVCGEEAVAAVKRRRGLQDRKSVV